VEMATVQPTIAVMARSNDSAESILDSLHQSILNLTNFGDGNSASTIGKIELVARSISNMTNSGDDPTMTLTQHPLPN
jgi:hypothetical protein